MGNIISRLLQLPDLAHHSVFLWGPRKTGKRFKHYLFMELVAYRAYRASELDIRYWRTSR